jgi:adenosylcobinamide-phosphate synthase
LESLAENTSDGVVAPVFWGLVAGLPGIAAYKAINTLDSMIGHRTERHDAFGKVAARLDDLVNLIPARLTGLLFALSVPSRCWAALRGMWQEARHHRSPNAGWPEAALAAGLDVRLSGPRIYGRTRVDEPWIHEAGQEAVLTDLARGLVLYLRAMALMALALSGAALF